MATEDPIRLEMTAKLAKRAMILWHAGNSGTAGALAAAAAPVAPADAPVACQGCDDQRTAVSIPGGQPMKTAGSFLGSTRDGHWAVRLCGDRLRDGTQHQFIDAFAAG